MLTTRQRKEANERRLIRQLAKSAGKSDYEIAELIQAYNASEDAKVTIYDAKDLQLCEQFEL